MTEEVEILRVKADAMTCRKLKGDMGPDGACYIKLHSKGDEAYLERLVYLREGISKVEKT